MLIALAAVLASCGVDIEQLNRRPDKYYQQSVRFRAQVTRAQAFAGETLVELADAQGRRILVRTGSPLDAAVGDWVRVRGILVPQARVADRVLYDVVVAESIRRAGRPWFAGVR